MKGKVIAWVWGACMALAIAAPVWAQESNPVVDGKVWLESSAEMRKAFLVGAGSMLALEMAYSRRKGTPPPVAGMKARTALENMSLDQVSDRVTRWYEAHPTRRNMPVMGVIWIDMVEPRPIGQREGQQ